MQEHVAPPLVAVATEGSLADLPARNAADNPANVAFARKDGERWVDVTAKEFDDDVRAVAKGLVAAGIKPGDRVALMSKTRYEWTLVDFAAWTAGAVVVPIYETSSAEQVAWILADSGADAIVLETPGHQATLDDVRDQLPGLEHVWQLDGGGLEELRAAGRSVSDSDLEAAHAGLDRAAIATIIYTSGTTGRPKGVQLTHDNFMALSENALAKLDAVVRAEGASTLLFLPLAHVFARFIEVLCVMGGARMGHTADIKNLLDDFATFRPTFILSVPRVFEKVYNSAEAKATTEGKGKIFATAADTAIQYSTALDQGRVGLGLKARHALFDRLVYGKLRAAMGGQVQYAVSGGAPLGTRLGHFFRGIGLTVLEGYGLTETTAPATVNVPDRVKIGTVGAPLPGVAIRIADDGEILIRGDLVFNGGTPFVLMGSVAGAIEALDVVRRFDAATIVPGHGPVCGPEVIDTVERYLRLVQRVATDAVASGISPLDAARETDLGEFAGLHDAERIVGNLHRGMAELTGAPRGGQIDILAAFTDMLTWNGGGPLRCLA